MLPFEARIRALRVVYLLAVLAAATYLGVVERSVPLSILVLFLGLSRARPWLWARFCAWRASHREWQRHEGRGFHVVAPPGWVVESGRVGLNFTSTGPARRSTCSGGRRPTTLPSTARIAS
jgi:hypothetical protein